MKKGAKNIHIGNVLKAAVEASGISITALTKKVSYSRGAYYNHTKEPGLSLKILSVYSKALGHDFSGEVPAFKQFLTEESTTYQINPKQPETLEEALIELAGVYKKLALVQEKYAALLEEKEGRK